MQKTDQAPDRTNRSERLERLMECYANDVLRMCYFFLRQRTLAEDAMQDVFLKAYEHLDALREDEAEKAWLMRITVNTCRDVQRSAWLRHVDKRVTPEDLPEAAEPFTEADDSIVREVMRLKRGYREVIMLHYYQEMSAEECADALGITPSAFYRRLKRALEKLRPRLERWVFDDEFKK